MAESYHLISGLRVKIKFMGIYAPSETIMGPFEVHVYSAYLEIGVNHNFCLWQKNLTAARQMMKAANSLDMVSKEDLFVLPG